MTFRAPVSMSLVVVLATAAAVSAGDFIRGDINGDGVVSLADAHYYFLFYRENGAEPPCWQAADADNDHDVDGYEAHRIVSHLFDGDAPLVGPFPSPSTSGPSLGERGWLDCDGAGDPPLADPAAALEVLDATAPGGADRLARIRVRLSTPSPIAGYSGRVVVDPAAVAAVPWGDGFMTGVQKGIDLTHNPSIQDPSDQGKYPADVWFSSTRLDGDVLSFAWLDPPPSRRAPIQGDAVDVLDIVVCLAAGTRAGVYPLTLVDGELVDRGSARSIRPRLEGGALTVLADVTATGECPGEFPPDGAPFVRGDANGDGRLSVSDIHFSSLAIYDIRAWPECWMAMDVNDDGELDTGDQGRLLNHLFAGEAPPAGPFGPERDGGENDIFVYEPCVSYGNGSVLADPAARLEALDAVAPGGESAMVTLVVTLSSTGSTAGLSGALRADGGILHLDGATYHEGVDLTGPDTGARAPVRLREGSLEFGYVRHFGAGYDWLEGGTGIQVLELTACLAAGTKAGTYAFTVEDPEIIDARTGRAILPPETAGTITVLRDIEPGAVCPIGAVPKPPTRYQTDFPPPPESIQLQFELIGGPAAPGDEITMPFYMRADAEVQAYVFSVDFDEEVLEARAVDFVWQRPDGKPYDFVKTQWNNENTVPGGGGVAEGFIIGHAVVNLTEPTDILPANRRNEVLRFRFRVNPETEVTSTEVAFLDGAPSQHNTPVSNWAFALGRDYTPETASSFLLINGYVSVLPEISTFVRGDSNGDQKIDVADPIRTLGWLFVGLERPACYDAADADDSGAIDIADAVGTLNYLFAGGAALPMPHPDPGEDPTEDDYGCVRRYAR